jgi:hypothetical protein
MAGVVHIPWYATVFRGDKLADAVVEIAEVSLRYGATQYRVHRSREDAYKLDQMVWFESKTDFARYWDGPEMNAWRARNSGRYQVPVLYAWNDEIAVEVVSAPWAPTAPSRGSRRRKGRAGEDPLGPFRSHPLPGGCRARVDRTAAPGAATCRPA